MFSKEASLFGRLDYAAQRMNFFSSRIIGSCKLGDFVEQVINTPDEVEEGEERAFAFASAIDGRVRRKGLIKTKYSSSNLRQLEKGDILVSGIDVVRGSVGVVPKECVGHVVSKEYFVLRVRANKSNDVIPQYIASVLRSVQTRSIIEGVITGVSNRTRIDNCDILLSLPINPPPALERQKDFAKRLDRSYKAQDRLSGEIQKLQDNMAELHGIETT